MLEYFPMPGTGDLIVIGICILTSIAATRIGTWGDMLGGLFKR